MPFQPRVAEQQRKFLMKCLFSKKIVASVCAIIIRVIKTERKYFKKAK